MLAILEKSAFRLRMPSEAVVLPEIVAGRSGLGCSTDGLARPELELLWGEARKALETTVLTREQRGAELMVVGVERTRSPYGHLLERGSPGGPRGLTIPGAVPRYPGRPGVCLPPGIGTVFFAPDADLLLSDPFIESHRFGLVEQERCTGLSFARPLPSNGPIFGSWALDQNGLAPSLLQSYLDREV